MPPEPTRSPIDERTRGGEHGKTSEYPRDRIRCDDRAQPERRLRLLIAAGLESGEGRPLTHGVADDLHALAPGRIV